MGLGIENDFVEVYHGGVGKKQIEVLKRFCEDKAFHLIAFCFRNNVFKGGIAGVGSAVLNEIREQLRAHLPVFWRASVVIKVVSGFHDFGAKMVRARDHARRFVIENFRLDTIEIPHFERGSL